MSEEKQLYLSQKDYLKFLKKTGWTSFIRKEQKMYIKDLQTGKVRLYGTNCHDSLRVSLDGRTLSYENLQNGDGSRYGDYRFCDEEGKIPNEDEVLIEHGASTYFNIGGFDDKQKMSLKEAQNILKSIDPDTIRALLNLLTNALECCEQISTTCGPMILPKGAFEKIYKDFDKADEKKYSTPYKENEECK